MIRFAQVTKRFGAVTALEEVSLEIQRGEFVLLTGPSGAGKSTLLRLIFAAEQPDHGDILLADWNVTRLRASSIPYLRRNIGVVFQDFKLLKARSALHNVALALEIRALPRQEIRERATAALQAVGLGDRCQTPAGALSGGEQQRVAIARAVVASPSILLADEPTGNLDPEMALGILDLLARIARLGTTVLVATHDPLVVKNAACTRMVMLDRGRLVANRTFSGPKACDAPPELDRQEEVPATDEPGEPPSDPGSSEDRALAAEDESPEHRASADREQGGDGQDAPTEDDDGDDTSGASLPAGA